jgi:hypothetical protein
MLHAAEFAAQIEAGGLHTMLQQTAAFSRSVCTKQIPKFS